MNRITSKFSKKFFLNASLFILVLIIILFALKTPQINYFSNSTQEQPDFVFKNMKMTFLDKGKKVYVLTAQKALIDKQKKITELYQANGDFFHDARCILKISSPITQINLNDSKIEMIQAQANSRFLAKELKILAQKLIWQPDSQKIFGQKNIQINSDEFQIKAESLIIDLPIKKIILASQVQGSFLLK